MAGLSAPRISFWAAAVNSVRPAMGRYSWLRLGSLRRISSACYRFREDLDAVVPAPQTELSGKGERTFLTTGRTHGFALSSR